MFKMVLALFVIVGKLYLFWLHINRGFDKYCNSKMLYREGGGLYEAIFRQIMGQGKPEKRYSDTKRLCNRG